MRRNPITTKASELVGKFFRDGQDYHYIVSAIDKEDALRTRSVLHYVHPDLGEKYMITADYNYVLYLLTECEEITKEEYLAQYDKAMRFFREWRKDIAGCPDTSRATVKVEQLSLF